MARHELTKVCKRCGEEKPASMFNRDRQRSDGLHPYCTPCKTAPYAKPGRWERYDQMVATRTHKKCPRCERVLEVSAFGKGSTPSRLACWCRECVNDNRRERYSSAESKRAYARTGESQLVESRMARQRRKLEAVRLLGGGCSDCGIRHGPDWPLACFDFHHVDETKEASIAVLLRKRPTDQLAKELRKCVLLCATCHRRKHADDWTTKERVK